MSDHEEYVAIREKWAKEDDLINHRLTWLLYSQTILFAAYVVLLSIDTTGGSHAHAHKIDRIVLLVPFFGLVLAFILTGGIIAAMVAQHKLNNNPKGFILNVTPVLTFVGYVTAMAVPLLFLAAWCFVLFV